MQVRSQTPLTSFDNGVAEDIWLLSGSQSQCTGVSIVICSLGKAIDYYDTKISKMLLECSSYS